MPRAAAAVHAARRFALSGDSHTVNGEPRHPPTRQSGRSSRGRSPPPPTRPQGRRWGRGGPRGASLRRAVTLPAVSLFSRRLPHLIPRADLVAALTRTYAAARGVDDEEAAARLERALEGRAVLEELYAALSAGLFEAQGPRTSADALLDRLSAGVEARRGRVRAAPDSPALAAVLVRLDLEIGVAPEPMRATLSTPRGRAMLEEGMAALGRHLVKELLRG